MLDESGYDAGKGLYLGLDEDWSGIPERPTRADAETALQTLLTRFSEFPFVSAEDRAVHVACILIAIERRLLGACPIFGYNAPRAAKWEVLVG